MKTILIQDNSTIKLVLACLLPIKNNESQSLADTLIRKGAYMYIISHKNLTMLNIFLSLCIICIFPLFLAQEAPAASGNESYGSEYYDPSTQADPAQQVIVHNATELRQAVEASTVAGNVTIIIEDGTYNLDSTLNIIANNITIRSSSGNRDAVILRGSVDSSGSMLASHIFRVSGNYFRVQDLTLGRVYYHGIQILGEDSASYLHVKNVHFFDIKEQMLKGSFDSSYTNNHSDYGVVENCLFEYTSGIAYQYYCGGIDVHGGKNWIIRDNVFKNIKSPDSNLTEGAVHFWNLAQGTIVERNIVINCDRGIMFGMEGKLPHYGGIIRNNFVQTVVDTGIYICNASGAKVYNNTLFLDSNYSNAIEYRYTPSDGETNQIINNLCNKLIRQRDDGIATVQNNITSADSTWFVDAIAGDLHLKLEPTSVIAKAIDLSEVRVDIDREARSTGLSDIGADQKINVSSNAPSTPTGVSVELMPR